MFIHRLQFRFAALVGVFGFLCAAIDAHAAALAIVKDVELQPFAAQVQRVIEAADYVGAPLKESDKKAIAAAIKGKDAAAASETIQKILDLYCLVGVNINPESRVKVAQGPAKAELVEQGWRQFLVKVHNEAGVTAELRAVSPNAESVHDSPSKRTKSDEFFRKRGDRSPLKPASELWLDAELFNRQPMKKELSGLTLEYAIIELYSRDAGKREAKLSFNVGQGTQDLGFRNDVDILFNCLPSHEVTFRVRDENNQPTTAAFVIRDHAGQVYPSQAKRLAPDFAFHPQIYRADGEGLKLPDGTYTVDFSRGPESIAKTHQLKVDKRSREFSFKAERWIDPSKMGWWSGDHHIHAAGCAHYERPTEGVHASDMMRHILGEDLKVGCNLHLGSVLRLSEAILYRQGRQSFAVSVFAPLRCGSLRLWVASIGSSVPAAAEGRGLSGRRFQAALADSRPEHAALGEEAGRGGWTSPFRLGLGSRDGRAAELHGASVQRDWGERIHRGCDSSSPRTRWQARSGC